jgi:hypothetical protein
MSMFNDCLKDDANDTECIVSSRTAILHFNEPNMIGVVLMCAHGFITYGLTVFLSYLTPRTITDPPPEGAFVGRPNTSI